MNVDALVLATLRDGPGHGYAVIERLRERSEGAFDLAEGTVYLDNVTARAHACCADFAVNLVDRGFERLAAGGVQLVFAHSNVGAYAALTLWPPASPAAAHEGR